ncbi:hypothetical protein DF286_11985 [Sphingosinicella humi]|uniref:Uncharacterized protein n=1 Tax=Allosphingosinicella humi TaxID=2068657 RepID=A0A2U2J598_9SPHN|nr:hypothetical protein DF286_11985 [Sphingosinicella humi]
MQEVARLIGGPAETLAVGKDVEAENTLHLQMANLIIMGTACSRPLLQDEATDLSKVISYGMLIVRLELDPAIPEGVTFDYLGGRREEWIDRALMWQDPTRHGLWLVPSAGEGRSVRLSALSREVVSRAPFYSLEERTAGLERAASSMRALREPR